VGALEAQLKSMRSSSGGKTESWKDAKKQLPPPDVQAQYKHHSGPSKSTITADMRELQILEKERKQEKGEPKAELGDAKSPDTMHPKYFPSHAEIQKTENAAEAHAEKLESEGKLKVDPKVYKAAMRHYHEAMARDKKIVKAQKQAGKGN